MEENQIGRQIAENRRAKGLTQEQLAEEFGVSPQAVSKWENGASCPDILTLPQLADFFGQYGHIGELAEVTYSVFFYPGVHFLLCFF